MKKSLLSGIIFFTALPFFGQQWWQQNANTFNDLNVVIAASDAVAYTYGDSIDMFGGFATGTQFKTTNSGAIWNYGAMGSPVYTTNGAYFFNNNTGFLVGKNQLSGNGFIIRTSNGGMQWTEGVPHSERLEGVSFANTLVGYVAGRNDYVAKSIDGGINWVDVSANTGDHLNDVFFTTPANGYVVGRNGVIAYTSDSATTWNNQNSNTPEHLNATYFINDSTGWAVGRAGAIVFTNDYGNTWTIQNSGTNEDFFDVEFVNDTTGWAVGTIGTIMKTIDAGATWAPETSGTNEDIFSITMRNEQLGWFSGTNGALFVYAVTKPNSINEVQKNLEVKIAPNPFNSSTTFYLGDFSKQNSSVQVMDVNGRIVRSFQIQKHQSQYVFERGELSSGIYMIKIYNKNAIAISRMVVN